MDPHTAAPNAGSASTPSPAAPARWARWGHTLLARSLAPLLLAWLWWRGRREPAYRERLGERLGFIPALPQHMGGLWLHAASVGEVQAAQPLIDALLSDWPPEAITVSTQTPTGAAALQAQWGNRIRHVYAPLDTPGACARFLDRLQPQLLVLIERELWPEWLHQCRQRVLPVALVNARLSASSAAGYRRWGASLRPAWAQLQVAAADAESAQRLRALGVPEAQLRVCGNLKFDRPAPPSPGAPPPSRRWVVAGSTHAEDEAAWLACWADWSTVHPNDLLVLVPRHPQRFEVVAQALAASGLRFGRQSGGTAPSTNTQVWLVDAMGQLMDWYQGASLCFIGGTLAPVGGHNPLEPLALGKPLLFGPHTHNAEALYQAIEAAGAGHRLANAGQLTGAMAELLSPARQAEQRAAAAQLMQANRGATEACVALLRGLWAPDGGAPLDPAERFSPLQQTQAAGSPGRTLWHQAQRLSPPDAALFQADQHPEHFPAQRVLATGSGRGQVLLLQHQGQALVLRHYRRGGLVARLSKDLFWRSPVHHSRAMAEYLLLRRLRGWGLPVPEPLAASHQRHGLFYRADIAVGLIPDAQNLAQCLQQRALSEAEWAAVGAAIGRMHRRQVFHSDLNCHNLMLDTAGQVWLIDFDKCGLRPGEIWKVHNLARLQRSLRKEAQRLPKFHWTERDWPSLLAGHRLGST